MKLKYLAHSTFLITAENGTRIITDPYESGGYGGSVNYPPIGEAADVVTVSHEHFDHNHVEGVAGHPAVVKGPGEHKAKGIAFNGVRAFHDASGGSERGTSDIMCFEVDGLKVCHMGDLGHALGQEQLEALGQVDVLLLPVGGLFTVDGAGATAVLDQIKPRVVIPMHYKTPKVSLDFAKVDGFLEGKEDVVKVEGSEVTLQRESLPEQTRVMVLKPALA